MNALRRKNEGLHLEAWLAMRPRQEDRDRYGQRLVDFFHHCAFVHGLIHADPHPGNYLFRKDGQLGVIDFGCVKRLPPSFVTDLLALKAVTATDLDLHRALHRRIGLHYRAPSDPAAFSRFFREWIAWLDEPYQSERFDFSQDGGYFRRGARFAKELYRHLDHYDGTFVYYARAEHGLFRLLERLGARVRMRPTLPARLATP
jgi:hypothetical protein